MPEPSVLAADGAQATLAGAAVTLTVAGLGWLGTRKSRPETTQVLVDSAVKLAQAATESEHVARTEMDDLRGEVAELRALVDQCERKHAAALSAMASAGIVVDA
jgi:hypothetical protein